MEIIGYIQALNQKSFGKMNMVPNERRFKITKDLIGAAFEVHNE